MRIRHTGVVCQNADEMKAFYEVMGFKTYDDHVENVRIIKMKAEDTVLELLQYESQSEYALRKAGISHIAFTVDPEGNYLEMVEERANVA